MAVIFRIGLGRSSTGAILDRTTTWYKEDEKEDAIQQAIKTRKPIFVSVNGSAYREITITQLERWQ